VTSSIEAEDEVLELAAELIRIDTTNTGDPATVVGEREAAEYVAAKLTEVGYEIEMVESGAPRRDNVFARLAGADPSRGALLVHGHLDVVPAEASEWSVHPFSGAVRDGYLWGRGAVDMKNMVGMILAVARRFKRDGVVPPRDIVFAFLADEEAGGKFGSQWLVDNRPDLFVGCTEAIGEVGGFSLTMTDRQGEPARLYLIETAEKGIAWMRLTARGTAGHGSMLQSDNAVTELAEAVARIGRHEWPVRETEAAFAFAREACAALGVDFDPADPAGVLDKLGSIARMVGATMKNTANPTMLSAGYKVNVIPQVASAQVDGRILPGHEEEFFREIDDLAGPGVQREFVHHDVAVETSFDGDLVAAMQASLAAEDPEGRMVPYCLSGGTDAKSFARLGIRCFGFTPLRLPPELDFAGMFHGVDERVPVEALKFGTRVLDNFLDRC
jgi:acetylornithine deacetylase/succinyl-diaminopimelate desuccinylase-like protein